MMLKFLQSIIKIPTKLRLFDQISIKLERLKQNNQQLIRENYRLSQNLTAALASIQDLQEQLISLSLHAQFDVIKLKLHLRKYPENSYRLAVEHFQDYLEVVERYKQLQEENQKLKSISLFPVQTQSHGQLQRKYDDLLKSYQELMRHHSNLVEENKALLVLLEKDSNLSSSLKRRQVT